MCRKSDPSNGTRFNAVSFIASQRIPFSWVELLERKLTVAWQSSAFSRGLGVDATGTALDDRRGNNARSAMHAALDDAGLILSKEAQGSDGDIKVAIIPFDIGVMRLAKQVKQPALKGLWPPAALCHFSRSWTKSFTICNYFSLRHFTVLSDGPFTFQVKTTLQTANAR
jgi:hypothetical protein